MTLTRAAAVVLSLWLTLAFAARDAAAADVADEAQFHFARGTQLYRQGRFEDALSEFYASNRLVPNRNVRFNVARCLEQLKLYDEAFRAWSALASGDAPANERASVEAAIEKLRPHLALLRVTTDPPGAEIYVNRRDLGSLGTTPSLLALPPGQATIILERAGYRASQAPAELSRGAEVAIATRLERIFGAVTFRGLPPGATVRQGAPDGPPLPVGPTPTRLVPGHQVLFVSAPGAVTARVEVDVPPDDTATLDVPLAPLPSPTGAIVVRANLDGALVRVDGREMGFSPTVIEGVLAGERVVELEYEGREAFRTKVVIQPGQRAYLDVRLRPAQPQIEAANKHLTRAEDAPASITVITADQIRALGYLTLSEALRGIRGVVSSNDRTYESIGFRGLSPPGDYTKRVLVLVDGHPTNDVVVGQGYVGHDLDVDLANVERIEVVRGAGSVLYGTGALFGVINVVTRRPPPGVHGEAAADVGSLETNIERLTLGARGAGGEVLASAAAYDSAGERAFDWSNGSQARLADGEKARHAELQARGGPVSLRAGFNDRTKTVPTGVFSTRPVAGTTYRDVRAFAEARLDQPLGSARLSARAAYDFGLFQGHYLQVATADTHDDFRSQWLTGEARVELPALANHHLTLGTEVKDELEIRQRSFQEGQDGQSEGANYFTNDTTGVVASGYAVDDWAPSPRLRVNAGLRADNYTKTFGWTVNPRLAVIARPYARGNTKLLLGRAFRAPSSYERFYNDMGVSQLPAGTLAPETILSGEIEHTHVLDDDVQLVVAAFADQLSNMIVLEPTASNADVFRFENEPARVRGVGAEGEIRWDPGAGTFLSFSYSWHRTRLLEATGARPLPNAPTHVAAIRFTRPLIGATLRLGAEVDLDVGRSTVTNDVAPDALLCNVTLSGETRAGRALRVRYFGGVFNLLDERAGYPVGPEVGAGPTIARQARTARLGLALVF